MKTMNRVLMDSPIGHILIVTDSQFLTEVKFPESITKEEAESAKETDCPVALETIRQLKEYFQQQRTEFDLPLKADGTEFQMAVWKQLRKIPFGETWCYGDLAKAVGNPKASRAVGAANGKNPIPIIIPCHRVIGKNNRLTGFGGGLNAKLALLRLEKVVESESDVPVTASTKIR